MGLHLFNIGDIPVSMSLWYPLLLLYWFRNGEDPTASLIWAIVVTISILVHELGHAIVARYYRLDPSILLHGFGGLCFHQPARQNRHDAFIIAAGPSAGLLLGLATLVFSIVAEDSVASSDVLNTVVKMSLYVNIGWSLINLLPIWPLDGGRLFRLLLLRWSKPARADKVTHVTSLILLALALFYCVITKSAFLAVMVLWAIWDNVNALRGEASMEPVRTINRRAPQMLNDVKVAYTNQDFKEAARLGQVLRHEANVADPVAKEGLLYLGLASARIGNHAEALTYLRNMPSTRDVVEARIECLFALGRERDLAELLESGDFLLIPAKRRQEILEIVREKAE
jgi:Zn-dependent protease